MRVGGRVMGRNGKELSGVKLAGEDVYELHLRKDGDGFDLSSDAFRCGPIWYSGPDAVRHAVEFARFRSRRLAQEATVRVLDANGTVVHTYRSGDDFRQ
jgi:hypothetical protein